MGRGGVTEGGMAGELTVLVAVLGAVLVGVCGPLATAALCWGAWRGVAIFGPGLWFGCYLVEMAAR